VKEVNVNWTCNGIQFHKGHNVWMKDGKIIPNWTPDECRLPISPMRCEYEKAVNNPMVNVAVHEKAYIKRLKNIYDKEEKRMKKQGKKMVKALQNSYKKQLDDVEIAPNAEAILNAETPEHTMKEIVVGLYQATLEMLKYAGAGSQEIQFGMEVIRAYNEYEPDDE